MKYVNNAFSLKMLKVDSKVNVEIISYDEFIANAKDAVSAIGHPDTAKMFGLQENRISLVLNKGDILYVAELNNPAGTRLPVGITEIAQLPDGFYFRFLKVTVY